MLSRNEAARSSIVLIEITPETLFEVIRRKSASFRKNCTKLTDLGFRNIQLHPLVVGASHVMDLTRRLE